MKTALPHSALTKLLATLVFFVSCLSAAVAGGSSFEDTFAEDMSSSYQTEGGGWSYDSGRRCFVMAKLLPTNNESMWAVRQDVALPRAFTFEADFTADGNDASAALALKNPETGDHVLATVSLKKDEEGGWWVTAWIVYSYPDEKWGYLQQTKKHIANLVDLTFTLQLTRSPGSNALDFVVANSDLGTLETSLSPETRGEDGKELSPAWIETLDALSQVGLFGYDTGGAWSRVKLTDLTQ
ncbi:MAG: hypothetical protein ACOYMS_12730 [Terrimicrobiaceae bacterium]